MGRTTWIRTGLCLLAVLALLCMGLALAESEALAPELSVNAAKVCRGEVFEVNVGAVEGADAYKVSLLDENGETRDWAYEYDAGVFYISTAEATPGAYTLEAEALDESENAIGERASIPVQVTDSSAAEKTIVVNVKHRENPNQNNFICVSAYAPGADYVYIDWVGFDEFAADPRTPDGLNLKVWDEPGVQEFYAVATYPDGDVVRTERVSVDVAELPAAGEVSITDMPTHLVEGEDFSASYSVARTVESELRVKVFTTDSWDEVYNEVLDGSGTFTIPAWREGEDGEMYATFEAGRLYEIYVILTPDDKVHYGQAWENRNFAVVPAAGDQVHLSIADAADEVELDRGQDAPVAISAQGATAVRLWVGEECVNLRDWGEWEEWSQSGEIQFNWSFWDKRAVYAEACFAEDPWAENAEWVRSNSVIVKVNTSGRLETPLVALSPSVPRGELLDVHVSEWDERTEWRYAVLRDTDWNEIFWLDFDNDDPYLPTAQLEPGRYILNVGSGAAGLDDGVSMRWFEVTEPEDDIFAEEVHWKFTSGEVATHEVVSFSAFATDPDVTHIDVDVVRIESGDEYGWWDGGNCISGWFSADQTGKYEFTAYLYRDGEEESFAQSSFTLNVTADGTLDSVQLKLPGTLALEQPLNGTIVPVEGAEWYSLNIGYNRDGEWEWFENHDQEADDLMIDYDGHWFNETGLYRLSVGAHAHGKSSSYADAYLVVQPEEDERVTLSIGGETETLNCVANTQLPLVVTASGGADVQYFDGNGWRGIDHLNNEIGYSGSESFDGGDYTIVVRAWFDELGEWRYSNSVTVHAEITGEVGVLDLILASNEVARGDVLDVSFDAAENATEYNMHVRSVKGDYDSYIGSFEPGTHKLPTAMLAPDVYKVTVDYRGPGCDWRSVEQEFTVIEGSAPEGIIASLSANEIACSKRVILSVYAPGAEMIRIFNENNPDEDWFDEREGDTFIRDLNWDHPETLLFTASACYNGEWSERVEVGELRVVESPQLDKPEIKLSSSLINAGEDVVFSFAKVENATQYWYELRDNDIQNGNDQIMDGWCYEPASVTLPASLFRAGHTYRIEVHVGAPGYETNDARYSLAVRPELVDGDITLRVNGETESVEGWVSDGFRVVADAPENATAIIVSDGMDWRWQPGHHFEDDFWYDFNGEVALIARYTVDKIDLDSPWWENAGWAGYSNPVTVRVNSNGNMPMVEADVPASVTRSEFMEIRIANAATFMDGQYDGLWLHAEAYFPDEDHWYGSFDWDGEGTILLPTAELEAGRTYELHVRAGADGWAGSTHVYQFSVTEPENGGIVFSIDKTKVVTGEDFAVSVYVPGADKVKLFEGGGEIDWRDGAGYAQMHSHGEATELRFHAEAHIAKTGEWVRTETITVTVTAPYGDLNADALGLTMPTRLNAGKELIIRWNEFDLQNYDVDIERMRDGMRVWHSWNDHGETETTIPVEMPEEYDGMEPVLEPGTPVLEAGEFYRVNLYFQRYGWNSLHIEKQIVVVSDDMYAEGLTLFVDGQTDAYATLVNVDVPVKITAPQNATAILAWNGYGWEMYSGNEAVFTWAWGDANERMLYARYTTDTIAEGKDWMEYGWSRVSNIVTVNVTKQGDVEAPIVTLSSDAPLRGDVLSFSVANADNGYNWTVYDTVDDWERDWTDWNGDSTQEIDTFGLEGNRTYLLCVYKYGDVGYEGTRVEIPFTVTANGMAAMPEVEVDASIAQGDVLTIRIKNPEAGELFRAWFWQEETGTNFASDWNGKDTIYLPSFNLTPGVYTELYIQNDGGYGLERSLTMLPIEVTEPSGQMSLCLEKTDLVTQEQTYIVAYAPGAQSIRLYACHADDPDDVLWDDTMEGELWQGSRDFSGLSGDKIVTAVATYPDGSTQTRTAEVHVTAPYGDLPNPVITVPDIVENGATATVSIYAENAEWWFVEVCDRTGDVQQVMAQVVGDFEEHGEYLLDDSELEPGHTYSVFVYAARYGWNEAIAYKEFTVNWSDDPYAENVLRLPAVLREIEEEAFEGISAHTVVIPDGATTIGSRAFANCGNLKYVEIPDSVTSIAGDAFYGCNVTFICNTGSPAYAYAQEYGIPVR